MSILRLGLYLLIAYAIGFLCARAVPIGIEYQAWIRYRQWFATSRSRRQS